MVRITLAEKAYSASDQDKVGDPAGAIHPHITHSLMDVTNTYALGAHCKGHGLGKDKAGVRQFLTPSQHLSPPGRGTDSMPSFPKT